MQRGSRRFKGVTEFVPGLATDDSPGRNVIFRFASQPPDQEGYPPKQSQETYDKLSHAAPLPARVGPVACRELLRLPRSQSNTSTCGRQGRGVASADECGHGTTKRAGNRETLMDKGAGGWDIAVDMLLMLDFTTRHPGASCGAAGSYLPPLEPTVVTVSGSGRDDGHEDRHSAAPLNLKTAPNQQLALLCQTHVLSGIRRRSVHEAPSL